MVSELLVWKWQERKPGEPARFRTAPCAHCGSFLNIEVDPSYDKVTLDPIHECGPNDPPSWTLRFL